VAEIDRSIVWPYDEHGEPGPFTYARYAHPIGAEAERALGARENGEALLYASGMAAELTVVLALGQSGATIAVAQDSYFGTSVLFRDLERWGLSFVEFDQTGAPPPAEIVWIDAPSNPLLTMPNWTAARESGALVVCDATVGTPVYVHALDEGADVVVHSATKFLTGHHDALLGATITRDPALTERLKTLRGHAGPTASQEAAAKLLHGLADLDERMHAHTESASELARRLEAHPAVALVRYPGFGGLLSFDVADGEAARRVEMSTRVIANQTSLGGVTSSLESRHRWEGDRLPTGLLRLSVGLEGTDALWADLEQAFKV
jgi:cystathionine gamma-synthase